MPSTLSSISQLIKKCVLLKKKFSVTSWKKNLNISPSRLLGGNRLNAFANTQSVSFQKLLKYNYCIYM